MLHRTLSKQIQQESGWILRYFLLKEQVRFDGLSVDSFGVEVVGERRGKTEAASAPYLTTRASIAVKVLTELASRGVKPDNLNAEAAEILTEVRKW